MRTFILLLCGCLGTLVASAQLYSGKVHTSSHGGHYSGGSLGSSHKGGHYTQVNGSTHYGRHSR